MSLDGTQPQTLVNVNHVVTEIVSSPKHLSLPSSSSLVWPSVCISTYYLTYIYISGKHICVSDIQHPAIVATFVIINLQLLYISLVFHI